MVIVVDWIILAIYVLDNILCSSFRLYEKWRINYRQSASEYVNVVCMQRAQHESLRRVLPNSICSIARGSKLKAAIVWTQRKWHQSESEIGFSPSEARLLSLCQDFPFKFRLVLTHLHILLCWTPFNYVGKRQLANTVCPCLKLLSKHNLNEVYFLSIQFLHFLSLQTYK